MPIEIGFALLTLRSGSQSVAGIAEATEADLRYDFALGDMWLRRDGAEIEARWGWVPLLDAAAGMSRIVDDLAVGKQHLVFDFTESDHEIRFDSVGSGHVRISTTIADVVLIATLPELRAAVDVFVESVMVDAIARMPGLQRNPTLSEWYPRCGLTRLD